MYKVYLGSTTEDISVINVTTLLHNIVQTKETHIWWSYYKDSAS
jgi:hypothetical protein